MPIVLGIFDTQNHAETAVLSLVEAGFERFDVRLADDVAGLLEQGLAEEDAETHAEGIRRGGIVVGVRCFPDGVDRAAEVMRKLGAVDVSSRPAGQKRQERIRTFGEMLEGSMRPMRAGETEKERRSVPDHAAEHGERLAEMDPVYGGGTGQKGEDTLRRPQKKPRSEDKFQKDLD